MKPLRIVIVTRRFWPWCGGPERFLSFLACAWKKRGADVSILTLAGDPSWPEKIQFQEMDVLRLPPPGGGIWGPRQYRKKMETALDEQTRDQRAVIYVSGMNLEVEAAMNVSRDGKRFPVVIRPQGNGQVGDVYRQIETTAGNRIKRRAMEASAFVPAIPIQERELIAAGYPRDRIHLIPDGVKVPPPRTEQGRKEARLALSALHLEFASKSQTVLGLWWGRLNRPGDLEALFDGWKIATAHRGGSRLWLLGIGPKKREFYQAVYRRHLENRLLLPGIFEEMGEVLAAGDLFLQAGRLEDGSVNLLEAMAAGLPIVAADLPGNRHYIEDGREGLLVEEDDPDAWAKAIHRVLDDPAGGKLMGENARSKVLRDFSLDRCAEKHLELFESLRHGA